MIKLAMLRPAALAVVTLLGAAHLTTADAAVSTLACTESQLDRADAYAQGYCEGTTGGNWSTYEATATCYPDGSVRVSNVSCE